MSLKPSRIPGVRKRGAWRKRPWQDGHAFPRRLSPASAGLDDEDDDRTSCDPASLKFSISDIKSQISSLILQRSSKPGRAAEADVACALSSAHRDEAASACEVPVKLRHLKVAAQRGHLEAMYLLAQECDDRRERIHWLMMAAERGHVPAMHDLGLASVALHERRRWLLRAARQGWTEAAAELGDVECS